MTASPRLHAGTLRYTAAGLGIAIFWLLLGEFAIAMRERAAPAWRRSRTTMPPPASRSGVTCGAMRR